MTATLQQKVPLSAFSTSVTSAVTATTAGRLLTMTVQAQETADIVGVTDSAGNTWLKAASIFPTAQKHAAVWYCLNAASITSVTVTAHATTSMNINADFQEWAGSSGYVLRGANSVSNGSSTTPPACTATVVAGDLVVSSFSYLEAVSGTRQDTIATGTVLDPLARGTTATNSAYKITALSTSDGCSWTLSPTASSGAATATFGPPVTPTAVAQHVPVSNFGTSASATVTATTAGRLLTMVVQAQQTADISSISDSAGNVWVRADSIFPTAQKNNGIWYCQNAASITTVTINAGATGVNINGSFVEWAGSSGYVLRSHAAQSNGAVAAPAACVANVTAGDIVLSGISYLEAFSGTRQDTIATGTELDPLARGTTAFDSAYKIAAATGTDGCSWTFSPAVSSGAVTATFGPPGANVPPIANAGPDQSVEPFSVVTLTSAGSVDTDGTITGRLWSLVSSTGPTTPVLSSYTATSPTYTARGVWNASYTDTWQVQVTDNNGATNTDTVVITVRPSTIGIITNPSTGAVAALQLSQL